MFEKIVQKIISPLLSEYVEDFNAENMKIGLWSGQVVIKNVKLKKQVIKKLNLPFKLKYSRLGCLRMTIPWKSLGSSKIQIDIDGLQLLITQLPRQAWDCKDHKVIETRKKQIVSYCESILNDFAKKTASAGKEQEDKGFISNMLARIIDNIQVTVKDIHVRYEDQITKKYSFGATLEELKIFTVNKKGEQEFIDRTKKQYQNEPIRKKLFLSNLGFYWNEASEFYNSPEPHTQMLNSIARTNNSSSSSMNYLILMSSQALLFQRQAGKQYVEPEINFIIDFEELKVKISNQQLQQIVTLSERLQGYINEVKAQNRIKLTQEEMLANRTQFLRILPSFYEKKMTAQDTNKFENIVQKMQIENFKQGIKAYMQQKWKEKMIQDKLAKNKGWFSFSKPKQLTEDQMKEIQTFMKNNFGEQISLIKRPEDFFYIKVNFNLRLLNIAIANTNLKTKKEQGISLSLTEIKMDFNLRQGGYLLNFGMENLKVDLYKKYTDSNQFISVTNILQKMPQENVSRHIAEYVVLKVVGSPLDKKHLDTEIVLRTEQMLIEFDARIIKVCQQFADIKISEKNTEAAIQAYGEMKTKVATAATEAATNIKVTQKKTFLSLDVTLSSVNILIFFDPSKTNQDVWVINLGETKVFSDPQTLKKPEFAEGEAMQKYCMKTSNMSMVHYQSKSMFFESKIKQIQVEEKQKIISELTVDFQIELFKKSNETIPKIRAKTTIHTINLNLSHITYPALQKIGNCFIAPEVYEQNVRKMSQKQKSNEKSEVMKGSRKIGIIYEQSKDLTKYIAVLSGSYLYLYADKKDVQYKSYYYVKNSKTSIAQQTNPAKKPIALTVENPISKFVLGFDKEQNMQEWVTAIKALDKQEDEVYVLDQSTLIKKQSEGLKKKASTSTVVDPNNLNFQVLAVLQKCAISTIFQDNKKSQISVSSLTAKACIHESKTIVKVSLKSIQISDNIHEYKYKQLSRLLYSTAIQGKQKLIDITFEQLAENHPDYDFTDAKVAVEVGGLVCNYKPQTVQKLMLFFVPKEEPVSKIEQIDSPVKSSNKIMSKISVDHHDEILTPEQIKNRKIQKIKNDIKNNVKQKVIIKLSLKFEQVSISLVNIKTKTLVAKLGFNGFKLTFSQSTRKMSVLGGITELWLTDYSNYPTTIIEEQQEYSIFSEIVSSFNKQRDMVSFDVTILQVPNEKNKTMLIQSSLNDLKISYIQQPVLRLIAYLTEQLLPSFSMDDIQKSKQVQINDKKPEDSPMDLDIRLQNILAIVQPRTPEEEYLELLLKSVTVVNRQYFRPFIKDPQNQQQKVQVQNYEIKLNKINIIAKYKNKQSKLTNDLNIQLSCDLVQNTAYYRKTYKQRYQAGMRITCKLSPFLLRINHDDYSFMMKCLNYNVTFDDNAEGYLYDGQAIQEKLKEQKKIEQQPMYVDVAMDRIILCVTEKQLPLSVLLLSNLNLNLNLTENGMIMKFKMGNLYGTNITMHNDANGQSTEKGMFNSFGFERKLLTKDLYEADKLIDIYSINNISKQLQVRSDVPVIDLFLETTKTADMFMRMKIHGLKIAVELGSLLTLSKLAITEQDIVPTKSSIKPIQVKKVAAAAPAGRMKIIVEIGDFLCCLSDKSGKNYVVVQGEFLVNLSMNGAKSQEEVFELSQKMQKQGKFLTLASHNIKLNKFCFYFCNVNELKNKRFILLPLNLNLMYDQQYGIINNIVFLQSEIDGTLQKIIVQCSVRDLIMLNKILQDNLAAMAQYNKQNQKKQKGVENKPVSQIQSSQVSQILKKDEQIDIERVQKTIKQVQQKIKAKTKATVVLEPMQIKVVNDCNNNFMPVLNFVTQQSNLLFSGDAIKKHLAMNLTIKFDFFNPRSANWEPIIQSFKISLDYLSLASQYGSRNKIIISNTQIQQLKQLKFNLSTQFVTSLLATIDIAKTEQKKIEQSQTVQQIQVSPYIISNKTHEIIKIQRFGTVVDVAPLFKGPLKLNDKAQELGFIYKNKRFTVSLQRYGLISVPGLSEIHLDFKMQKLNRMLCFVDSFVVRNSTVSLIYCIRYDENQKQMQDYVEMPPGDLVPLKKDGFVKFSFSMKSFSVLKRTTDLMHCGQIIAESQKFKLGVKQDRVILGHSIFVIRSPFKILNCLPKDMQIQFIKNGKQQASKKIPAQMEHQVFANASIYDLNYKINCEGFYWSEEFGFQSQFLGKELRLYLSDREQGGTHIKYIFQKDEKKNQFRMNIFCPAFIISELDYNIQIYSNLQKDEKNKQIQKYYKLGGQSEFWRKQTKAQQKRMLDKVTIVDANSGSKIRVCGKNCLIDFSQPIAINNLGVSQTRIVIQKQIKGKVVNLFTVLGVEVELKKMAMRADIFTRQITLRSRWIFYNDSQYPLSIKEQGGDKFYYTISKGEKKPFLFIVPDLKHKPKGLIFKAENTGESVPIMANGLGSVYFRLQKHQKQGQFLYFKLNVQQIKSYLYYDITQVLYENLPYQIIVQSPKLQAYVPLFNRQVTYKSESPLLFINQVPHQPYRLPLMVRLKGSKNSRELTVQADNLNFKKRLNMFEQGITQMYIMANVYVIFNDSKKFIIIDELHKQKQQTPEYELNTINFRLQKISLSLIQNHADIQKPFESFYFYMSNLQFMLEQTNKRTRYQTKLQFLQLDQEQPYNIPNPVIITPIKYKQFTSNQAKDKPKSIFNALIQVDNSFVKNMFINQIVIDINDIVIRVGSPFIKLIMQIAKEYTEAAKAEQQYLIQKSINTWEQITPPPQGSKTFIKSIRIAPFTVQITAQVRLNELDTESVVFFGTILNALGVVITNIQDAPIVFYGIALNDCVDTLQGINSKLVQHYKNSVILQLYKIFGSLNIIGNPVSLFRNISTGFKDLKDRATEGFVEGPLEFGKGLGEGAGSLIAHSVGGAMNSVQKVTGTIASGLAALTFDKEFEEMREKQKMKKPKHVFEGLEKGGKAIFHGFADGITGVFLKPIQNAKKEGAVGFFKGTAQGLAGLVVKPVSGVIDFASKTTEGLKNTAMYLEDKPNETRIRYPRALYTETGMVKEYNPVDSKLLSIINKTKYEQKYDYEYAYFMQSFQVEDKLYLLMFSEDIIMVNIQEQKIIWSVAIANMRKSRYDDDPNLVSVEGPPKNQQFWEKGVKENIRFHSLEETERFCKLIDDLKANIYHNHH